MVLKKNANYQPDPSLLLIDCLAVGISCETHRHDWDIISDLHFCAIKLYEQLENVLMMIMTSNNTSAK